MDGSSESTAASIGFDGRVHTTEADRRPPVRRVLANFTAVAQIALLAIALLAKLDAVGSISTTNYVNSMWLSVDSPLQRFIGRQLGGLAKSGTPGRKWRGVDCMLPR